tara:strand:- start:686 stop:1354 length:669 start_codon:yes stop_codon:yes gene_type:complete
MTKNELKELVKQHFNLTEVSEKFASATLEDGTKVLNDKDGDFAVDQKLFVITEEGDKVSAPEGEHITKSGIQLIVNAEGFLTGVKYPDKTGEGSADLAEETVKEEMATESTVVEEEVKSEATETKFEEEIIEEVKLDEESKLEDIIEIIGEVVEEKMAKINEKMEEVIEDVVKIKDTMSKFAAEPAEEKTIPSNGKKFNKEVDFANERVEKTYNRLLKRITK